MEPCGKPVWETDRAEVLWEQGALSPQGGRFAGPARLPTVEEDLKTTVRRTGGECTEHLNTN